MKKQTPKQIIATIKKSSDNQQINIIKLLRVISTCTNPNQIEGIGEELAGLYGIGKKAYRLYSVLLPFTAGGKAKKGKVLERQQQALNELEIFTGDKLHVLESMTFPEVEKEDRGVTALQLNNQIDKMLSLFDKANIEIDIDTIVTLQLAITQLDQPTH